MRTALLLVILMAACGPSYTADDRTANAIAARNEAHVLTDCASDDAGATTCTPARVRARTELSFCANQRELSAHGAPFDGGIPCHQDAP